MRSLTQRLKLARTNKYHKSRIEETSRIGTLRAGNSGLLSDSGDVAGSCPRVAHVRQLGIETDEPTFSARIMFDRGYNNEDIVAADLLLSLEPGEMLLQEEAIPTEWFTTTGVKVTGRPDIVICRPKTTIIDNILTVENVNPILGIELKSVASFWTAREVLFEESPKLAHLIQAAHYMWKLNVPYRLVYRQYSNLIIPDWPFILAALPKKETDPKGQYINKWNKKTGKPQEVLPFEIVYELRLSDGKLQFRLEESEGDWQNSVVTTEGIHNYYEFVATMEARKDLGKRPMTVDLNGKKLGYSTCSYCPLEATCDKTEKLGYDIWLDAVKNREQNK